MLTQRVLEDLVDALWPGSCRSCGVGLPVEPVTVPRAARRYSALHRGRVRRAVLGGVSLPLWLACPACCATLRPATAIAPLEPRPGEAAIDCVTAFEPGPVLFDLVHAFKYEGVWELGAWFGAFLARVARRHLGHDLILIPVPLHPSRERRRGFNQSALLARAVAQRLGCAVADTLLVRQRDTAPQARLAHAARSSNVAGAFARPTAPPAGTARVVLVDDVVTTGATVAAALRVLECSPERAAVLALCRARDAPPGVPAPSSAPRLELIRVQGIEPKSGGT